MTFIRGKKHLAWVPIAVAVGALARQTIAAVLAKVGHPGAALDDAYIHFQYARAIAEGHPMRFQAGAPVSTGATSLLWPALLAPFWAVGARDNGLMWPAWALCFLALGGLAWEASRLTERLAGGVAALGASAMTIAFGGFAWCAASGMEVVPFAWAIARASRRASEWAEASPAQRTPRDAAELIALAWVAALFRPEGAVTALFVGATLAVFPTRAEWRARSLALAAIAAACAPSLLLLALTGSARSSTAVVKLLPGNPYFTGHALIEAVLRQAKQLVGELLNGGPMSVEFIPHAGAPVAMAGLGAIVALGARARCRWRAAATLILALMMFAPCLYYTFLWNRLRYLWPFATGWIVGLACLARVLGDLASALGPAWRAATGLVCGTFVGLFASKLEWVIDDVAQSASGIDRQQVALGRWAKEHLPRDARVGLNDTGAIAYFSDLSTFDIVGLTTPREGGFWVAGVGSRLEHYERLHARAPAAMPTHFIVYPNWLGIDALLGETLHEATVTDSTILGGSTMRVAVADWTELGSGEAPWTMMVGEVLDVLDVADLESEAAHDYELLGARDGEEAAYEGASPDGATLIDGGRTARSRDRFVAHLPRGARVHGIVRLAGPAGTEVHVLAGGEPADSFELDESDWVERGFDVPAAVTGPRTLIELRTTGGTVTVFHYWFARPL